MSGPASPPAARPRRRLALLVVVLTAGCGPTGGGEGPGHRAQRLALSPRQEYELGVRAYDEVLGEARQKNAFDVSIALGVGHHLASIPEAKDRK